MNFDGLNDSSSLSFYSSSSPQTLNLDESESEKNIFNNNKLEEDFQEKNNKTSQDEEEEIEENIEEKDIYKKYKEREYQKEIFLNSQEKNSIICLETGTGKTLISGMLIYYYLKKTEFNKKIAFLANTIQLVQQQADQLKEDLQFLHKKYGKITKGEKKSFLVKNIQDELLENTKHKNISFEIHHGFRGEEIEKLKKINKLGENVNVIVITPQIFLNSLRKGKTSLDEFSLLIFDECHHTDQNHPYHQIMEEFYFLIKNKKKEFPDNLALKEKTLPFILGLTASPLLSNYNFSDYESIEKNLNNLRVNLDSNFVKFNTESIKDYVHSAENRLLEYESDNNITYKNIENFESLDFDIKIDKCDNYLKKCNIPYSINGLISIKEKTQGKNDEFLKYLISLLTVEALYVIEELGIRFLIYLIEDIMDNFPTKIKDKHKNPTFIDKNKRAVLEAAYGELEKIKYQILNLNEKPLSNKFNELISHLEEEIESFSKKKKEKEEEEEEEEKGEKEKEKEEEIERLLIIIFVKRRYVAKYMNKALNAYFDEHLEDEELKKQFKSNYLIGFSNDKSISHKSVQEISPEELCRDAMTIGLENIKIEEIYKFRGLSLIEKFHRENQIQSLDAFRKGKNNILIATNVAEEGLDIPSCNLVISYDSINSITEYIQEKGRARKKDSTYLIIQEKSDNQEKFTKFKEIHKASTKITQEMAMQKNYKENENYKKIEKKKDDLGFDYRRIKGSGALITSNWSLNLLNNYCQSLNPIQKHNEEDDREKEINSLPIFIFYKIENLFYICGIKLPYNAKKRYFLGEPRKNKDEAKKNAGFIAVIYLFNSGCFDMFLKVKRNVYNEEDELESENETESNVDNEKKSVISNKEEESNVIFLGEDNKEVIIEEDILKRYDKLMKNSDEIQLKIEKINGKNVRKRSYKVRFNEYFYRNSQIFKNFFSFYDKNDNMISIKLYQLKFKVSMKNPKKNKDDFKEFNDYRQELGFVCFSEILDKDEKDNKFNYDLEESDLFSKKDKIIYYLSVKLIEEKMEISKKNFEMLKKIHYFLFSVIKDSDRNFYAELAKENIKEKGFYDIKMKRWRELIMPILNDDKLFCIVTLIKDKKIDWHKINEINNFIDYMTKVFKYLNNYYEKKEKNNNNNSNFFNNFNEEEENNKKFKLDMKLYNEFKNFPFKNRKFIVQDIKNLKKFFVRDYWKKNLNIDNINQQINGKSLKETMENLNEIFEFEVNENIFIRKSTISKTNERIEHPDEFEYEIEPNNHLVDLNDSKLNYRISLLIHFVKLPIDYDIYFMLTLFELFFLHQIRDTFKAFYFKNFELNPLMKRKKKNSEVYNIEMQQLEIYSHIFNSDSNFITQFQENFPDFFISNNNLIENNQMEYFHSSLEIPQDYNSPIDCSKLENNNILRALTTKKYNPLNNLESFEFFGDSVLKLLSTIEVYCQNLSANEGELTLERIKLINNKFLSKICVGNSFYPFLLHVRFPETPPGFYSIDNINNNNNINDKNNYSEPCKQVIQTKNFADCIEAFIALFYFYNKNLNHCQTLLQVLGILKNSDLRVNISNDNSLNYLSIENIDNNPILNKFYELERKIKYKFKNIRLLIQAFTHPSFIRFIDKFLRKNTYMYEEGGNLSNIKSKDIANIKKINEISNNINCHDLTYERLEFLGDAVLDFIVVEEIFNINHKNCSPALLTNMKSSVVNNRALSLISLHYDLYNYALIDSFSLKDKFNELKNNWERYYHDVALYCEIKHAAIKVLADLFEGLIGAIFIDCEFNIKVTKNVILPLINEKFLKVFTKDEYIKKFPRNDEEKLHKILRGMEINQYIIDKVDAGKADEFGEYLFRIIDNEKNNIVETTEAIDRKTAIEKIIIKMENNGKLN